jgi:hypothetical protein
MPLVELREWGKHLREREQLPRRRRLRTRRFLFTQPGRQSCQCFNETFCTPGGSDCPETGPDGITKQVPGSCGGNCGHGYFCHTTKDSCLDDGDCAGGFCTFDPGGQAWLCATACIGPV